MKDENKGNFPKGAREIPFLDSVMEKVVLLVVVSVERPQSSKCGFRRSNLEN